MKHTQQNARQRAQTQAFFGLFALGVVPGYTLLFASQESLIHSNMSKIGGVPGRHLGLAIWGLLCGTFFLTILSYLCHLTGYRGRGMKPMLYTASTLLVMTTLVPFVPEALPRAAQLHNILAIVSTALTFFTILRFVHALEKTHPDVYRKARNGLLASITLITITYLTTGVSGLFEVVFILTMSLLLFGILAWINQPKDAQVVCKAKEQVLEK